jgi:hypothetical protein
MNLADVFTFLFVILGFVIAYVAYWLATVGLFPQLAERCAERIGQSPVKTTLVGLAVWVPTLVIGTMISNRAPNAALKGFGVIVLIVSILVALAGSSGLALRIGTGLKSTRDEQEPWRRTLRGGIVLGLTFVPPFVGTLVMAWTLVVGFGAFVLPRPRKVTATAAEPAISIPSAQPVAQ